MSITTVYTYNDEDQLTSVHVLEKKKVEVRLWKKGNTICYSVTRGEKFLYGGSMELPNDIIVRRKLLRGIDFLVPFDEHTLMEILAHLKKAKGGR